MVQSLSRASRPRPPASPGVAASPAPPSQAASSPLPFAADFRNAMRRLTSAVTVISTAFEGHRCGMTATAVTSVSTDPPSLLVCINRASTIHDPMIGSGRFCVNILQAHQIGIAEAFSGAQKGEDRFSAGAWSTDPFGIPHLAEAQANIFCGVDAVNAYGTHSVIIGKVQGVLVQGNIAPLLYQDGRYTVGLGDGVDWVVPIG